MSLLSIDGAKDCVLELNSLSKSSNMAGWRVGMLSGAKERIDEVLRFKSNMDSGMFLPLQLAVRVLAKTMDSSALNHERLEFATLTKSEATGQLVWHMLSPEEIDELIKNTPLDKSEEEK